MTKKKLTPIPEDRVIETPTIRLSTEETRLIMRAQAVGTAIDAYNAQALTDLGIMRKVVKQAAVDIAVKTGLCWKRAQKAVAAKDQKGLESALSDLSKIRREGTGHAFVLTELGKQIARGLTVRLNGQYRS